MLKIKKKDKVLILTGKHKKQTGIVSKIIKNNGKVLVIIEGMNLIKKHIKANPNKEKSGGIVNKEAPIDISNIININENSKKKIKFKIENKKKYRVFKYNNEVLN